MWCLNYRNARGARALWLAIAALLAGSAPAALAQDPTGETRLRKIEAEVRALQRKVFPGGDERFFQPEVSTGKAGAVTPSASTTSAVTDMLSRMDAIEAQLARLTGQVEESANRISVLEERAGIVRSATATAAGTGAVSGAISAQSPGVAAETSRPVAVQPVAAVASTPAAAATSPTASRLAAVRAIEKPQTGDPGDDEYSYGFRLWEAKFFPEARQQLKLFVDKYPRHGRASFGRNLLGRSFLDDGQPAEAAKWFLENYQADRSGARASDSLLYLAASMKAMKDSKRACIALAEFSEAYAAEAAGRLKAQYSDIRRGLACSG